MKIMGIDYGTKRIGIAISDPWGSMSLPLETIQVKKDQSHMQQIQQIVLDYEIEQIVLGMPYNMDGSTGPMAERVKEWSNCLRQTTGLEIVLWDERLSSFEAHDLLTRHNVPKKKHKDVKDKIAASLILQSYLDEHPS
ncbi:MAG: Holliday junction resolvase RuvX [Thermodesulfobacteriota bacterium]|nr:Holliday junction resolvase RuvX [Thermodesulfobacteriota bacterium]